MNTETHKMLLKRAGALLALRAYSRDELRSKLAGLAGDVQIESVLKHLEQLNLLNDADYAYNFALQRLRQRGWSPAKVQHALLQRCVGAEHIESALGRVQNEVGEQPTMILEHVQRHCEKKGLPTDRKGIRKLILHLRQRGFNEEDILSALRRIIPAAALQPFETGE